MKFLAVFAVLACLSAAAYAGIQPKSVLTEIIEAVIKNNKHKLENLVASVDLKEHGWVNGTMVNLENFVHTLEAPGPLSLKISNATVSWDLIQLVDALYEFIGVEIPELGTVLDGTGKISADVQGLWVTVALDCAIKGLTFQIKDFHDLALSLKGVSGLVLEGIEQDVIQTITEWIPSYVQNEIPKLAEVNKDIILEKINEVLAGLTY